MEFVEYKKRIENTPFTQGLQYAYAWWAGAYEERYKKMPVCVSALGATCGGVLRFPYSYENKWGNVVPVVGIRDKLLSSHAGVTDIILPNSLKRISNETFSGCSSLERIYLPKALSFIPQGAFHDCQKLTDVYYEGTEAEWQKLVVRKGVRVKNPQELGLYCQTEEYALDGYEELLKARVYFNCVWQ